MSEEPSAPVPKPVSTAPDSRAPTSHLAGLKKVAKSSPPYFISLAAIVISLLTYIDQHNANEAVQRSAEATYAANASFWLAYAPPPPVKLSSQNKKRLQEIARAFKEITKSLESTAPRSSSTTPTPTATPSPNRTVLIVPSLLINTSVEVHIENRNNTPITNVSLAIQARQDANKILATKIVEVGTIPPCSIATITSIGQDMGSLADNVLSERLHSLGAISVSVTSMDFTDSNGVRWRRYQNDGFSKAARRVSSPSSLEFRAANNVATIPGCL